MKNQSDRYETPHDLFNYLNAVHGPFELDACAEEKTAKCDSYHSLGQNINSLETPWEFSGIQFIKVWCNPPYSNPLPWVEKAVAETKNGVTTCMLLPADVSTKWFRLMADNSLYYFWDGRIRFLLDGARQGSPKFGSVVALFLAKI